jgi:hypothetical protein
MISSSLASASRPLPMALSRKPCRNAARGPGQPRTAGTAPARLGCGCSAGQLRRFLLGQALRVRETLRRDPVGLVLDRGQVLIPGHGRTLRVQVLFAVLGRLDLVQAGGQQRLPLVG